MSEIEILKVRQGSDQWLAEKAPRYGASEAASMMAAKGAHMSRDDLLRLKATGMGQEFSDFVLGLFERGHKTEKKARKIFEKKLGEDLFPSVFIRTVEGLPLIASLDGIDMGGSEIFEHKIWNKERAARIKAKELEPQDYWQLEHQLLVTDAELVHYVCSDGTKNKRVKMKYRAVEGRREQLIAGWLQFKADSEDYKPVNKVDKPTVAAIMELPALNIRIKGEVLESNLGEFETTVMKLLEGVKTNLRTDQDFADATEMVKYCKKAEEKLEATKEMALGQTEDIDLIFKTITRIQGSLSGIRLKLDKDVKNKTAEVKAELVKGGTLSLQEHIKELGKAADKYRAIIITAIVPAFPIVIKGKRNIDTVTSAINDELARCKVLANEYAKTLELNFIYFSSLDKKYSGLFLDLDSVLLKPSHEFKVMADERISTHVKATEESDAEDDKKRITAIEERVNNIREKVKRAAEGGKQKEVKKVIRSLEKINTSDGFGEFKPVVEDVIAKSIALLKGKLPKEDDSPPNLEPELQAPITVESLGGGEQVDTDTGEIQTETAAKATTAEATNEVGIFVIDLESYAEAIREIHDNAPPVENKNDKVRLHDCRAFLRLAASRCGVVIAE